MREHESDVEATLSEIDHRRVEAEALESGIEAAKL